MVGTATPLVEPFIDQPRLWQSLEVSGKPQATVLKSAIERRQRILSAMAVRGAQPILTRGEKDQQYGNDLDGN